MIIGKCDKDVTAFSNRNIQLIMKRGKGGGGNEEIKEIRMM